MISFLTVVGIGFIIFVHELGHYWAARAVGIRVEAFSIGFGKKIWGFRRGHEEWKICMIPLGGYVKMAGEDPTRPTTGKPDEFGSKKVWQRTLVISAGVIMNMIFAFVVLAICFAVGVPFQAPVIGDVEPGSAAWFAGIDPGDRIIKINDREALSFEDIATEAAVAHGPLTLTVERDGAPTRNVDVTPQDLEDRGLPTLGVYSSWKRAYVSEEQLDVDELDGLKRELAEAMIRGGFKVGDEILSVNDLSFANFRYWESERKRNIPVEVVVERDGAEVRLTLPPVMTLEPKSAQPWQIGIGTVDRVVDAVRPDSAATRLGLKKGDVILRANGHEVWTALDFHLGLGAGVEPYRGPSEGTYDDPQVEVEVRRGDATEELTLALPTKSDRVGLLDAITLDAEKGIIRVIEGRAAIAAGVRNGDAIIRLGDTKVDGFGAISKALKANGGNRIAVLVTRGDAELSFDVAPEKAKTNIAFVYSYEPLLQTARFPVSKSFGVGLTYSGRMLKRIYRTLRSMFAGSVSPKHLGGIITIFTVSNAYAERIGLMRMLLFLAVISINLAFINILPIPALDGGWLMFLIIEKIKGSPINERAMGYFQWTGLVIVVGLMLFVTWNDVQRLVATW